MAPRSKRKKAGIDNAKKRTKHPIYVNLDGERARHVTIYCLLLKNICSFNRSQISIGNALCHYQQCCGYIETTQFAAKISIEDLEGGHLSRES
jgi:hypothetical protein